jgi:hypothetical protein
MHETPAEITALQQLLDASFERSSDHLKSIMTPEHRLSARQIVDELSGVAVLNVATVTAHGEPRISALDGHFRHGRWYVSTAADSPKARQWRARPAISAAYTPRDGFGVFAHGRVVPLSAGTDEHDEFEAHLVATYGRALSEWGAEIALVRVEPTWFVGFSMPVPPRE